jgi:NADH-quinone oxidoreductase subunit N|uniref:NADH dehydrogenase subunit 2 n=1 Tax=Didymosphenia geminata TaxID=1115533 RepID=A0A1L4BMF2_9STRA|nr:NADH dehydrogenase subunit 2 [Didymosphenia geminata]API83129.1 NADH dehydrogenase subunit 2 [Didymosphenia geminata]
MMKKNITMGLSSIILLENFTVFPEYFVGISILYVLIVIVLITYSVYGLIIQKALSECMALIMFMTCYLIINDDLILLEFASLNNSFMNDSLSYITKLIICFFSALYFLLISNSLKEQKLTSFEYLLIILFAILGIMIMCSCNDLLTAYLSIELSSLALYILASYKKTSSYSIESGLKYFITGAVSSAFFLLGSSFLYVFSGSIHFEDYIVLYESDIFFYAWADEFNPNRYTPWILTWMFIHVFGFGPIIFGPNDPFLNPFDYSFIELGLSLIMFSLFIKLACAPFHLWSLDVYEGSPTSSSFFFAAISKLSIFVLLIRLCYISLHSTFDNTQFYCFWVGLFSVFVGSFGGIKQRRIKTLLAYSSITNMGYGLFALGTSNTLGIQMLFFHLVIYMISGLCTWSIFLFIRLKTKKNSNKYNKELCDIALLRKSNPALAFALALTMFSISGIPPMIGFLAKMGVFLSIVKVTFTVFAVVSAVFSVVATFYYIRIIKVIYFENLLVGKLYYPINSTVTLILSGLVFSLILLFINPSIIYIYGYKIIPSLFEISCLPSQNYVSFWSV